MGVLTLQAVYSVSIDSECGLSFLQVQGGPSYPSPPPPPLLWLSDVCMSDIVEVCVYVRVCFSMPGIVPKVLGRCMNVCMCVRVRVPDLIVLKWCRGCVFTWVRSECSIVKWCSKCAGFGHMDSVLVCVCVCVCVLACTWAHPHVHMPRLNQCLWQGCLSWPLPGHHDVCVCQCVCMGLCLCERTYTHACSASTNGQSLWGPLFSAMLLLRHIVPGHRNRSSPLPLNGPKTKPCQAS